MKSHLLQNLQNRHVLLASVISVFFFLALIEAGLSGRHELLDLEIDNSFLQFKVEEYLWFNEDEFDELLEFLGDTIGDHD